MALITSCFIIIIIQFLLHTLTVDTQIKSEDIDPVDEEEEIGCTLCGMFDVQPRACALRGSVKSPPLPLFVHVFD